MSSNELDEISEQFVVHRGVFSTMPQKKISVSSEYILAVPKIIRENAGSGLDGLLADFERESGIGI